MCIWQLELRHCNNSSRLDLDRCKDNLHLDRMGLDSRSSNSNNSIIVGDLNFSIFFSFFKKKPFLYLSSIVCAVSPFCLCITSLRNLYPWLHYCEQKISIFFYKLYKKYIYSSLISPQSVIVTFLVGWPDAEPHCSIKSKTLSPSVICPKTVWAPFNQGVLSKQMKNWDPLVFYTTAFSFLACFLYIKVLTGPALAIDRIPLPVCLVSKFSLLFCVSLLLSK